MSAIKNWLPIRCRRCGDAGWVRRDLPTSDPEFGKPVRCMACNPPTDDAPPVPTVAERRRRAS